MFKKNDAEKLHTILEQLLDLCNHLEADLDSEFQLLKTNKIENLDRIIASKNLLIKKIENTNLNILEITNNNKLSQTINLMPHNYNKLLKNLWQKIQEKLSECDLKNTTNGQIINQNAAINKKILMNLLPNNDSIDYSKKGINMFQNSGFINKNL